MLRIGDTVKQEFGTALMTVIGFEPDLLENVVVEWKDEFGNVLTGKFMEQQLEKI